MTEADFQNVYQQNRGGLYRRALHYVGRQDADDVVQEACCTAWRKRGQFASDVDKRGFVWLFTYVTMTAMGHYQRQRRRRHARRTVTLCSPDILDERYEQVREAPAELPEEVADAIASLPPKQRRALRLSVQGYSGKEIAAVLGISHSSANSNITLARRALREVV